MPQTPSRAHQEISHASGFNRRYGDGPVGRFYDDYWTPNCPLFGKFTFVKYFRQDSREPQPPLRELIVPKLSPAPAYQAYSTLAQARQDFVLPDDAPHHIASIAELIAAFDILPPLDYGVMVELKFILRAGAAPHRAYEAVRGFALDYFANRHGLAAMLVLHLPGRSGVAGDNHIHLFIPARRLTAEGFGVKATGLVHDEGFHKAAAAWDTGRQASEAALGPSASTL